MNAKDTAERIRNLRKARGMSQSQFAAMCGLVQGQLANYEYGRIMPTIPLCERICEAVGISASVISQYVKGDIEPTIQKLLALEDLTGLTFREMFGECEGRR